MDEYTGIYLTVLIFSFCLKIECTQLRSFESRMKRTVTEAGREGQDILEPHGARLLSKLAQPQHCAEGAEVG
jgi:hypothetical protein